MYENVENADSYRSISQISSTLTLISDDSNYIFINTEQSLQIYVDQYYCLENQFYNQQNSSCVNCSEVLNGCEKCKNSTVCLQCD